MADDVTPSPMGEGHDKGASAASPDEAVEANTRLIGTGDPQHAPLEPPPASLIEAHPTTTIGAAVAIANAVLAAAAPLPTLAIAALIVVVTLVGAAITHGKVTPIAQPKLGSDTPLVPAP
jgi:hypothetical protein